MIHKKGKIHTRKIDIATYEGTEDTFIVEGVLKDDRLFDWYRPTGEEFPPGTIHHMIIRLEVRGPQLVIQDVEVEMPTLPHKVCTETLGCLESVKGLPIISGFTRKVKEIAGGPRGCSHLVALLIAMAPAAVQGVYSAMARKPIKPGNEQGSLNRFKDTCWAWRQDGLLMERYKGLVN